MLEWYEREKGKKLKNGLAKLRRDDILERCCAWNGVAGLIKKVEKS